MTGIRNETNSTISVVTDSAAALSANLISEYGLFIPRMEITINGKTYVDEAGGEFDDFYLRLRQSVEVPSTSAPKPAEYLEQYRAAALVSKSIFCVSLSARLSAAYDAAKVAAQLLSQERPDVEIRVFDSKTAAGSQALIAMAAAQAAQDGGSLAEVESAACVVRAKVRLMAFLDTIRFIHLSGRVPKIAVWAPGVLNIKPVMEYSAGTIRTIARPRSARKALHRIKTEMRTELDGKIAHVNVMHAGASDGAEELSVWASQNLQCAKLFVTQFHPFMGAHTGPGLVGASWWAE